jgi:hypothetical protein
MGPTVKEFHVFPSIGKLLAKQNILILFTSHVSWNKLNKAIFERKQIKFVLPKLIMEFTSLLSSSIFLPINNTFFSVVNPNSIMSFYIKINDERPFYRQGDTISGEVQLTVGKRIPSAVNISLFLVGTEYIEWTEKRLVDIDKEVMEDTHAEQRKFLHSKAVQLWNTTPPLEKSMTSVDQIYSGLLARDNIPLSVKLEMRVKRIRELQSFKLHKQSIIMEKKTIIWASRQGQEDVDPGYFAWPFEFSIDSYGPTSYMYEGPEGTAFVKYVLHAHLQRGQTSLLDSIGDSLLNFFSGDPETIALSKDFIFKSCPLPQRDFLLEERNTKRIHTHEKTLFLRGGVINFSVAIGKNTYKTNEEMTFEVVLFHNTGTAIANFDMSLIQHNSWKDGNKEVVQFDSVIATQKFSMIATKDARFYQVYKFKIPPVTESSMIPNRLIGVSYSVDFVFPFGYEYPMIKFPIDLLDIDGCGFHPNENVYPIVSLDNLHVWKPDHLVNECMQCKAKFGLFNRKHHCRVCGGIFCGTCSTRKLVTLGSGDPKRVCDTCFQGQKSAIQQGHSPLESPLMKESLKLETSETNQILIESKLNGMVLSIVDTVNSENSTICMMKKNGSVEQLWYFKDGVIVNVKTKLVLGIKDMRGADLMLHVPTGEIHQKWKMEEDQFVNLANSLVLDIVGENASEGAPLCLYKKKEKQKNQSWILQMVTPGIKQRTEELTVPILHIPQEIHEEVLMHPLDSINISFHDPYVAQQQHTIYPTAPREDQPIPIIVSSFEHDQHGDTNSSFNMERQPVSQL